MHAPGQAEPDVTVMSVAPRFVVGAVVTLLVAVVIGASAMVISATELFGVFAPSDGLLLPIAFAIGVIGIAFALDKALSVRRLERALADERAAAELLSRRVAMYVALDRATQPLTEPTDSDGVLDTIVARATELLNATDGALWLCEHGDVLRVAATRGARVVKHSRRPLDIGPAGQALRELRPIAQRADDGAHVWCVPLVHRGIALGVLECASYRPGVGTDLHVLALFAEPAAAAIAQAQLVATEREHVDELLTLDRMQRAFVSGIGHDLRAPLTALRGATAGLRRTTDVRTQTELLAVIDRQVERIAAFVQELVEIGTDDAGEVARLDLPSTVRLLALDSALSGRPVAVDAPDRLDVVAEAEAVRRILSNLVENAHTHGAAPVTISVRVHDHHAVMTVTDCGPGIAPELRETLVTQPSRRSLDSPHGIGLAIVRSLAETCGGTAWIHDAPSGGAAVSVSLRMRDVTLQEATWNTGRVC